MSELSSSRWSKLPSHVDFADLRRIALLTAGMISLNSSPLGAQDRAAPDPLDQLRACKAITGAQERLACFDAASAHLIAQNDSGAVKVVDQEEIRETRRGLFGFTMPKFGIFGGGGDSDEDKLLNSEVTGVRHLGRDAWLLTIREGSVWRVSDAPSRFRPQVGDAIELERAAMGSFWVRLNGKTGVKGRRVE